MINGLIYIKDFISEEEQALLINKIDEQTWDTSLKRRVQQYGYKYDYSKKKIDSSLYLGKIPDFLEKYTFSLVEKNIFDNKPDQVIINEYLPGQGISRHVDCIPCFEETIASISLYSTCMMEFETWGDYNKKSILLEPLSLLILKRDARYKWMHSIPPRIEDNCEGVYFQRKRRISLTFRKIIENSPDI